MKVPGGTPGWRSLIQGTGLALVLRVGGAGLGLAFNLMLARTAGAEGAGLFFLAFSVSGLLALASRLGLDAIVVRQTAAAAANGDWATVRADARAALAITLASAGLATASLWLLAPVVAEVAFHKPALVPTLRGLAFTILPVSLSVILAELLRGIHSLLRSQALQAIVAGTVALPLLALAGGSFGLDAAVWAQVAGNAVACVIGAWWWRDAIRAKSSAEVPSAGAQPLAVATRARPLLRAATPLFWFSMLNALLGTFDILMLGALGSASDVGIYGAAVRLASLTSFILLAANSFSGPHYAAAYGKGELQEVRALAVKSARLTSLAAAPLLVPFLVFPGPCLGLFGKEFSSGAIVLTILSLGRFINLVTGSSGQVLIMANREKDVRNISILCAGMAFALNYFLIPPLGATGAALSTFLAGALLNVAATVLVFRRFGIWVHAFSPLPRTR